MLCVGGLRSKHEERRMIERCKKMCELMRRLLTQSSSQQLSHSIWPFGDACSQAKKMNFIAYLGYCSSHRKGVVFHCEVLQLHLYQVFQTLLSVVELEMRA